MTAVLDSHVHLWDPAVLGYPWLAGQPTLLRSFLPVDLDAAPHDLGGIIVVEAGCPPRQARSELEWIEGLAGSWPIIRAFVAQAPLEQGLGVRTTLAELSARPLVAGVRRNAQDEAAGFLTEPAFVAGVAALAPHGLTFDACVRADQLDDLALLVDRCPDVTFILDHLGKPDIAARHWRPWCDDLAGLARRPNVYAKLSGLTTEADRQRWRPEDIRPYLAHALDTFGPQRCLFGSDWPVATLTTTYASWLDVVLDVIAELPAQARAAVLAGTAGRVYLTAPGPERTLSTQWPDTSD